MTLLIIIFGIFFIFMMLPLLFWGAPFMPSYRKNSNINFDAVFDLLRKEKAKKIIDLSSGDGRLVMEFAKGDFESFGVEINPFLVLWSRLKIKKAGQENVHIIWGNFWKINLKDFDVVFIFQFKTINKLLIRKFKEELKDIDRLFKL